MRLSTLEIKNYRSIIASGSIRLENLQAFVGENNAGKSNILRAIEVLLTAGLAGVQVSDFFDRSQDIVIVGTFSDLTTTQQHLLGPHLIDGELVVCKRYSLTQSTNLISPKVNHVYCSYVTKPKPWWLSTQGVIDREGTRPNWRVVAQQVGILAEVQLADGRVTKKSYAQGVRKISTSQETEYDEPASDEMVSLGTSPGFLTHLPKLYLLPAITDYSSEIDRRSSSTTFRRLMGDLSDRILRADPRYQEIEASLQHLKSLLNPPPENNEQDEPAHRLEILDTIEQKLTKSISRLMPTVESVQLEVLVEEPKDFFARGVGLQINDGVLTDVLAKGHGLQRSVVFGLLQTLIASQRDELLPDGMALQASEPIMLAIEEPELYIHPQSQRMIFGVLREFAESDQVIYTTHSPAFVDIAAYECIAVARKENIQTGTKLHQCDLGALGGFDDKKGFQFLNSFGLEQNQMFFARQTILVEGQQDVIAILAAGRKTNCFREFPEEIGYTIVVADNKEEIPKFQRLLNAFELPYLVWLELDGQGERVGKNKEILDLLGENRCVKLVGRLEDVAGYNGHFGKTYNAKKHFENPDNITVELEQLVRRIFLEGQSNE